MIKIVKMTKVMKMVTMKVMGIEMFKSMDMFRLS